MYRLTGKCLKTGRVLTIYTTMNNLGEYIFELDSVRLKNVMGWRRFQ